MNPAWKNYARASIYYHVGEGYYVLNIRLTDRGIPMETELVALVPESNAVSEIWPCVVTALQSFAKPISHAEAETTTRRWREDHNYSSWRHFAKKAAYCTVAKKEQKYILRKGQWDGRGFGPADEGEVEVPLDTPTEQLTATLISLLASQ